VQPAPRGLEGVSITDLLLVLVVLMAVAFARRLDLASLSASDWASMPFTSTTEPPETKSALALSWL
jgi:hypothetical protein